MELHELEDSGINNLTRQRNRPMTPAERTRACRKRKKEKDPEYQKKENERIRKLRSAQREAMSEEDLEEQRRQTAERVRLCRLRKKLAKQDEAEKKLVVKMGNGFKSPQSMGKAIRRLSTKLPQSPSKKRAAVAGLAKRVGLELGEKMTRNLSGTTKRGLSEEDEKLVTDFYYRTDIVYTLPGMKDEMTVWKNGVKSKLRKYYLVMFLKEVYALFKNCYPDVSVGFSKFASLRPQNVFLLKDQHPDQCKCQTHENFMYKLKGLAISYDETFWPSVLCPGAVDNLMSPCWRGVCVDCKEGQKLVGLVSKADAENVSWKAWVKSEDGRLRLDLNKGCVGQVKDELLEALPHFREHVCIKRIQFAAFEEAKNDESRHVLQVDFAMAYSCEYQNEVQSALWSRSSVNLFTGALYSKGQGCQSFLIVTNSQDKGKDSVFTFINRLAEYVRFERDDTFTIFTDGPTSEFKNRFMVKLVALLSEKYMCKIEWKYFATSHGKGVVDGIGGAAKSLVRRKLMSKGNHAVIVQSSEDFYHVVDGAMPGVTVIHISAADISEFVSKQNPWLDVKDAPGISKVHVIVCKSGANVELFRTNADSEACSIVNYGCTPESASDRPSDTFKPGDWALVRYDGKNFPGEVTAIYGSDLEVSVMKPARKGKWCWPGRPDVIQYEPKNVLRRLEPPVPVGMVGAGGKEDFFFEFSSTLE